MSKKIFSLMVLIVLASSYCSITMSVQDHNGIEIIGFENDGKDIQGQALIEAKNIIEQAFLGAKEVVEENVFGIQKEELTPNTEQDVPVPNEVPALENQNSQIEGQPVLSDSEIIAGNIMEDINSSLSDVTSSGLPNSEVENSEVSAQPVVLDNENISGSVIEDTNQAIETPEAPVQPVTAGNENISANVKDESIKQKFFNISFNKKTLLYFGAGAVALITVSGVTYVLYKNGTFKKVGKFVTEHKVSIATATVVTAVALAAGIYAKQKGISFESAQAWISKFFKKQEQEIFAQ